MGVVAGASTHQYTHTHTHTHTFRSYTYIYKYIHTYLLYTWLEAKVSAQQDGSHPATTKNQLDSESVSTQQDGSHPATTKNQLDSESESGKRISNSDCCHRYTHIHTKKKHEHTDAQTHIYTHKYT